MARCITLLYFTSSIPFPKLLDTNQNRFAKKIITGETFSKFHSKFFAFFPLMCRFLAKLHFIYALKWHNSVANIRQISLKRKVSKYIGHLLLARPGPVLWLKKLILCAVLGKLLLGPNKQDPGPVKKQNMQMNE